MNNIELSLIIDALGQPDKQNSDYSKWQCPLCQDTGKDNLVYIHKTNTIWCYADDTHAPSILKDIFKNKAGYKPPYAKPVVKPKLPQIEISEEKQSDLKLYMLKCNQELLQDKGNLNFLLKRRGISQSTVKLCSIGIDKAKRRWVFPTFQYSCDANPKILGFEYRPLDLNSKGIYREKGTPTCMAMINSYAKQKVLVMLEGYLDGYAFAEHLTNMGQLQFYHVITPSNGVANAVKLLSEIEYNFDKYSKIYVYLDSDKAGIPKMEELKGKYPFIETQIMRCGCKDFNEHYLKCILNAQNRTIL